MTPQPTSNPIKPASFLRDYLDPFWVSGLAVLCVLLGEVLWVAAAGLQGEQLEWSLYLTLGTIFPALLLAFSLPTRFSGFAPTLTQTLKLAFAVLLVVMAILFVLAQHQYYALVASAAHLLLIYALRRAELLTGPVSIVMSLFVVVVSWTAAAQFVWWSPYDIRFPGLPFQPWFFDSTFDAWFSDSAFDAWLFGWEYRVLVFVLSLLLVFVNLYPKRASEGEPRFRFRSALNVPAILILGLASVRSDQLFNSLSYPHWGVYVGPAEMVRQGGWLLWDVPSQYGFLNMLTIAFLPFGSVWQSLYIANSLFLFLSALFLFFLLRSLRAGFTNFCFSLGVTLAAVFLMAGWPPELLGPQVYPSAGAFRFFWCYALLGVLIWEFQTGSKDPPRRILLVGCITWLIGTLWSAESAVYCAAVWLPAYALLVLRKAISVHTERRSLRSSLLAAVFWLSIPPFLLLAIIGMIAGYYVLNLGHLPDWSAFFEYSVSFSSGYYAMPIDVSGPVLTLFLVFCALSATAAYFLRGGLTQRALSLIGGTWGALWATSSYFVPRSHPTVVSLLSPILCVAIVVTLYLLARYQVTDRWAMLVRTSFVPVLVVILTVTFGNAAGLAQFAQYITPSPHASYLERYTDHAYNRLLPAGVAAMAGEERATERATRGSRHAGYEPEINRRLPVMDKSLLSLLDTAGVKIGEPIVYVGDPEFGGILPAWPVTADSRIRFLSPPQTWQPTMPFWLVAALPDERKEVYMARFTERARLSGWLIQSKEEAPYTSLPWFAGQLQQTHEPTEVFENDDWTLTWFEFSGS